MNILSHPEIIGLDVSRDWLDLHCLSDGRQLQLPNTGEGHSELAKFAGDREALVCFEATGGHEWRLWASLEAAGIEARQLAPAQVKAFGRSRGTLAKTDRIDAELIACFMAFRPEAGRRLPSGKLRDLRALTTKRKQLVEMRKSARQQIKANLRNGTAEPVEDLTDELSSCWSARSRRWKRGSGVFLRTMPSWPRRPPFCGPFPGLGLWPARC